ncbi:MAG: translation elongation factor Ts [Burkholderiales bacterium]
MAEITAEMVKELRARTDVGMMECKKALVEANGDMDAAEQILRVTSGVKAGKASGRVAAEGMVAIHIEAGGTLGAMLEVNCETDFVAKNHEFAEFAAALAGIVVQQHPVDVTALAGLAMASGDRVEAARQGLVLKLGENITLRRFVCVKAVGHLSSYVHAHRIGVLVDLSGGDAALGRDLAMHVAASKPVCVGKQDVPPGLLAKEREIYSAQAAESGKPANIIEKMLEGRVAKYLAEITLLGQPFVKDPDQSIEKLLKARNARVNSFTLFVVGQGIEKKTSDFAAEVMAQAGKA